MAVESELGYVYEFQTERSVPGQGQGSGAAVSEPGPRLRFLVDRGERAMAAELSWTTADGAHTAIAFEPGLQTFLGVHRAADGARTRVTGRKLDEWEYPKLPKDVKSRDVLSFDAAERATGGGWHRTERLRLWLDDGSGEPVCQVAWRDLAGNSASISLNAGCTGFIGYYWRQGVLPVDYRGRLAKHPEYQRPPKYRGTSPDDVRRDFEELGRTVLVAADDLATSAARWLRDLGR